jgi:GT2 family glycosyltransferase
MSQPLISVIVTTFDRAGFVETAIESALGQAYDPLEVVVVDDGSADETPAVLQRIADRNDASRFRWVRHDNVGQAASVNRGLAESRGELICMLNSDDVLLPGAMPRLAEVAAQRPDVDVIYPWFSLMDAMDRLTDTLTVTQYTFAEALANAVCLPGVGTLARRAVYDRVGGWDSRYRCCPDFEWFLRAHDAMFLVVPEVLGVWRAHAGSITTSQLGRAAVSERLLLLDELFARDDLPPETLAVRIPAYVNTLMGCAIMTGPEYVCQEDSRFLIEDRMGPLLSINSLEQSTRTGLWADQQVRWHQRRVEVLERAAAEDRATIHLLREEAAVRRAQLAAALAQPAEAPPAPARPLWLRGARRLTPPALRPRIGATLYRLRGPG